MKYLSIKDYELLYARYMKHGPESLLNLAGTMQHKDILDLCSGGGRLTKELLKEHPYSVTMVEGDSEMTLGAPMGDNVSLIIKDIPNVFTYLPENKYDIAFCQQAVNYWLDPGTALDVYKVLKKDGLFIFNTYHNRPSEEPEVKEYVIEDIKFVEVSWLVDNTVYHIQCREGMAPHSHSFKWISPIDFSQILNPYFNVDIQEKSGTSLYRCKKKG